MYPNGTLSVLIFSVLILVHWIYFLIIRRLGNLSKEASLLTFLGGICVWYVIYLMTQSGTIDLDLAIATIEISDTGFFWRAQNFIENILLISDIGGQHSPKLAATITPAGIEEIGKLAFLIITFWFMSKLHISKRIENVGTAVGAISMVALGFATMENIQYFMTFHLDVQITYASFLAILARSLILPLVHMSFSLYSGYGFGKSIYMKFDLIDHQHIFRLRKWFNKTNKCARCDSYILQGGFIVLGLLIACITHIVYNFLLENSYSSLALVFSMMHILLFFYVFQRLQKQPLYQSIKERIHVEKKIKELKERRKTQFT